MKRVTYRYRFPEPFVWCYPTCVNKPKSMFARVWEAAIWKRHLDGLATPGG